MKKLSILILLLALTGFVAGLAHLFRLRFEAGDSYPAYSSFRADPLGTKALYESLDSLVTTRRHLQPLTKLGDGRDTALLWLGGTPSSLRLLPEEFKELETFARSGGRLVISLSPILVRPRTNQFALAAARKGTLPPAANTNLPRNLPDWFRRVELQSQWNLTFDYTDLKTNDLGSFEPVTATLRETNASPALPSTLAIHTALSFNSLTSDWRTIYASEDGTNTHSVLIERPMGRGSIVLCADSWPFSNEALRDDRQPALLSWLVGAGRQIVFEETHLGTSEDPGVATLARKYRLQPLLAAFLLLAVLFIWKSGTSFMPPYEDQLARDTGEVVEGRDSFSAFVNLLRRNIAPANLLRVCLEQWNATGSRKPPRAKLESMQRLIDQQNALPPAERNPVATYREFCRILSKKL
jgi:hypothetical protein